MFRFTIRDVLWLTVVVAIVLALWLGWTRDTVLLQRESAVREAKLRDEASAEREVMRKKLDEVRLEWSKAMIKAKVYEAEAEMARRASSKKP